jgi:hypothetical protein
MMSQMFFYLGKKSLILGMRIGKSFEGDTVSANSVVKAPVLETTDSFPTKGNVIYNTAEDSMYYGNGRTWNPIGGTGGTLNGDVIGPSNTNLIQSLQGVPLDLINIPPVGADYLFFDGGSWIPQQLPVVPPVIPTTWTITVLDSFSSFDQAASTNINFAGATAPICIFVGTTTTLSASTPKLCNVNVSFGLSFLANTNFNIITPPGVLPLPSVTQNSFAVLHTNTQVAPKTNTSSVRIDTSGRFQAFGVAYSSLPSDVYLGSISFSYKIN